MYRVDALHLSLGYARARLLTATFDRCLRSREKT